MRNPCRQPRERGALERPADRDPLVIELQRNGDGDERAHDAGDEREPAEVARFRRFQPEELPQHGGEHQCFGDRHEADEVAETALEQRGPAGD